MGWDVHYTMALYVCTWMCLWVRLEKGSFSVGMMYAFLWMGWGAGKNADGK